LECAVFPRLRQTPQIGWRDVPREPTGYQYYKDFDHTGLDILQVSLYWSSNDISELSKGYAGFNFGDDTVIPVGYNAQKGYNLMTLGLSRFLFSWEPRLRPLGSPPPNVDPIPHHEFPIPSLFCAVGMSAHAKVVFTQSELPHPFVDIMFDSKLPHPADGLKSMTGQGVFGGS
jgi:hypothetical protein